MKERRKNTTKPQPFLLHTAPRSSPAIPEQKSELREKSELEPRAVKDKGARPARAVGRRQARGNEEEKQQARRQKSPRPPAA